MILNEEVIKNTVQGIYKKRKERNEQKRRTAIAFIWVTRSLFKKLSELLMKHSMTLRIGATFFYFQSFQVVWFVAPIKCFVTPGT